MDYEELMSIRIIPKEIAKSKTKALTDNLYHTPYKDEIRLFSCLKQGDLKKLVFEMKQLGVQNITAGYLRAKLFTLWKRVRQKYPPKQK